MTDLNFNFIQMNSTFNNTVKNAVELHNLARKQFIEEHKAGSRSHARGILLAEIGTAIQAIYHQFDKIKENIKMLDELDMKIDSEAAEKEEMPIRMF
jgi:hypothetical protein